MRDDQPVEENKMNGDGTESKVQQRSYLDMAFLVQQNILQLQVPIDNATVMEVRDGERDFSSVEPYALLREHFAFSKMHEELQC